MKTNTILSCASAPRPHDACGIGQRRSVQPVVPRARACVNGAAFTLVELLVVISIIALLISLLLPALAMARADAESTVCLSNQQQLALSNLEFSQIHEGFILKDWFNGLWPNGIEDGPFYGSAQIWDGKSTSTVTDWSWDQYLCRKYLDGNLGVFRDPADTTNNTRWNSTTAELPGFVPASYRMDFSNQPGDPGNPGEPYQFATAYNVRQVSNPQESILICDGDYYGPYWQYEGGIDIVNGPNTQWGASPTYPTVVGNIETVGVTVKCCGREIFRRLIS